MKKSSSGRRSVSRAHGFTLIEMLVATAVLVLILVMTLQITSYANTLWMRTRSRIDTFQEARVGFESMTRRISQAMLNTYWDYADVSGSARTAANSGTFTATQYVRMSELHFVSGQMTGTPSNSYAFQAPIAASFTTSTTTPNFVKFATHGIFFQAPLGYASNTSSTASLPNLMNVSGFFVEYSDDNLDRPQFLQSGQSNPLPLKYRFRLKELALPSEYMGVNKYVANGTALGPASQSLYYWFNQPLRKNTASGASTNPFGFNPFTATPLGGGASSAASTFNPKTNSAQNVIALIILPQRSPNYPIPSGSPVELAPNYKYDSRAWTPIVTGAPTNLAAVTRNQLPPVVQVTMVAIDERSASRVQDLFGGSTGTNVPTFSDASYSGPGGPSLPDGLNTAAGVTNLFQKASKGSDTGLYDQYTDDLSNLEKALIHLGINYRVFSTNISILQAKWSE